MKVNLKLLVSWLLLVVVGTDVEAQIRGAEVGETVIGDLPGVKPQKWFGKRVRPRLAFEIVAPPPPGPKVTATRVRNTQE